MSYQDQIIARDQAYIAVKGSQLPADILNDLIRIEVESTLYLPDMVTIIFHDDELDLVDGDRFALGAALEVELDDRRLALGRPRATQDRIRANSCFIQEEDLSLLDDALKLSIILCSPLTLYAILAVIRL